jgi:transposase InsO family protein
MFDESQRELFPIMKVMESFYRTLKVGLIYQRKYETRIEAQRDVFEYIEIFYNRERLPSSIGYHSPEEYEKMTIVA